jgi:hypothetical protein
MKAFNDNNIFVRTPLAFALGSMTFTVGFLRLCVLSTKFTARIISGESPQAALSRLTSERAGASSPAGSEPAERLPRPSKT